MLNRLLLLTLSFFLMTLSSHAEVRFNNKLNAHKYWQRIESSPNQLKLAREILNSGVDSSLSTKEMFDLQIDRYLDDKEFPCRLPRVYRFLEENVGHTFPAPPLLCQQLYEIKVRDNLVNKVFNESLEPSRVQEIHLLYATSGRDIVSSWGHTMLRLVICPDKKQNCSRDLSHNIVIGFAALIEDAKISYWRGITGGYPSGVSISTLASTIKYYTEVEDRDLISIPLKISDYEKTALIERLLERYWSHDEKYKFLSRNCATEMFEVLKSAVLHPKILEKNPLSPDGLFNDLIDLNIINATAINDLKLATQQGNYFQARGGLIKDAYRNIVQLAGRNILNVFSGELPIELTHILSYFDSYFDDRINIYNKLKSVLKTENEKSNLALNFYQLEQHIAFIEEIKIENKIQDVQEKLLKMPDTKSELADYQQSLKDFFRNISHPPTLNESSYGIPPKSYLVKEMSLKELEDLLEKVHRVQALINIHSPNLVAKKTDANFFLNEAFRN